MAVPRPVLTRLAQTRGRRSDWPSGLRARGVAVTEWTFSPVSVGRLAVRLHLLLREHRLALPYDTELLDELATVRLRESRPGVYRLDHDAAEHDRAVALGLAALALTERAAGRGSVVVPAGRHGTRTNHDARPTLPPWLALRKAARGMPRGLERFCCRARATIRARLGSKAEIAAKKALR